MESGHDESKQRALAQFLSDQFGRALLAGDAAAAEEVARATLDMRFTEGMLYDLVVAPALHRVGRLWEVGKIGVGHEHLATQIATKVLVLAHEAARGAARRPAYRAGRAPRASSTWSRSTWPRSCSSQLGYEAPTLGADVPTSEPPNAAAITDWRWSCRP